MSRRARVRIPDGVPLAPVIYRWRCTKMANLKCQTDFMHSNALGKKANLQG